MKSALLWWCIGAVVFCPGTDCYATQEDSTVLQKEVVNNKGAQSTLFSSGASANYLESINTMNASGKPLDALRLLKSFQTANPGYPNKLALGRCYRRIAMTLCETGQYESALESGLQGINVQPDDTTDIVRLASLFRDGKQYDAAITLVSAALNGNPTEALYYCDMAHSYKTKGEFKNALLWGKKGIDAIPDVSTNYWMLGWIYADMKEYGQAEQWIRKAIEINSNDMNAYARLGDVLCQQHNYKEAIALLTDALTKDPTHVLCKEYLGRAYTETNEYEKAEALLQDAKTSASHTYACPYQALGYLYSKMPITNKKKKVLDAYIKTAELEHFKHESQYTAAQVCYEYGDLDNALIYINKALALEDKKEYRLLKAFIQIQLGDYDEGMRLLEPIATDKTTERIMKLDAITGMGHVYLGRKEYDKAKKAFEKMLEINSHNTMANLGMGWLYANQNKNNEALQYFDNILRYDPSHMLALLSRGNALSALKRFDDARKMFDEVLFVDEHNEYALAELGVIEYNRGHIERAKELFSRSIERNNATYACPYEGLGLIYLQTGNDKAAEENFKKSIAINPDIEYKKYNGLAKIYIKQGNIEKAKELLKKSIQNYPYDNEAVQLLEHFK